MLKTLKLTAATVFLMTGPAAAEVELGFYMGFQNVQESNASGTLPDGTAFSRKIDWEGNPLDNPFYYGGRATWWMQNNLGFGIEGTHTKAYAPGADRAALGVDRLEFADGHHIITANIMKRRPGYFANTKFTPSVGAGVGVAIPHVDIPVSPRAS